MTCCWEQTKWEGIRPDKTLHSCSSHGLSLGGAVAVCIASVAGVALLTWLAVFIYRKHKKRQQESRSDSEEEAHHDPTSATIESSAESASAPLIVKPEGMN